MDKATFPRIIAVSFVLSNSLKHQPFCLVELLSLLTTTWWSIHCSKTSLS